MRPWKLCCEVPGPGIAGGGADVEPKGDGWGAAAVLPNGEGDDSPEEPNGVLDADVLPKGEAAPRPLGFAAPKGDCAGAGALDPKGDCAEVGALDPKGDGAGAGALEPKGEADVFVEPEENGEGAGAPLPNGEACKAGVPEEGSGVGPVLSKGLGTLYFAASFWNISTSRPLYFSRVFSTSPSF